MTSSVLSKVVTTDDKTYFLLTELKDEGKEGVGLVLTDGEHSWEGAISEDDLDDMCIKMKMDFDSYVSQTVRALTGEGRDEMTFQYQVKPRKAGSVDFVWKKHVATENITFQLGTSSLSSSSDHKSIACRLFSHCITSMTQLKKKIHSLETDNDRLAQERTNALRRLEKCVVAKEELETELYSKFVEILNSKKEKIRQLKNEKESDSISERRNETADKHKLAETSDSKISRAKAEIYSDDEKNTDDESPSPSKQRKNKSKPGPKSNIADSSLILDDGSDGVEEYVVARPRRQPGGKKHTPAKPSLPRISSKTSLNSSTSSDGRRTSIRKSASSASNKSTDNVDADDLIENMF